MLLSNERPMLAFSVLPCTVIIDCLINYTCMAYLDTIKVIALFFLIVCT